MKHLLVVMLVGVASVRADVQPGGCTIAIAPVGNVSAAPLEAVSPSVSEAFGCRVEIVPEIPIPASAWNPSRRQTFSTAILDSLARVKRPAWERLLGVADVDLYVPDLNFVFGEGDSSRGVAVFSLARLHGADEKKRAATEAIHELGHTYGLSHCDDPKCVMWFSNTLAETDRKGTGFCERHSRELSLSRSAATSRSR